MTNELVVEAWAGETVLDAAFRAIKVLKLCGNQKVFVSFSDRKFQIDNADGVVSIAKKWQEVANA